MPNVDPLNRPTASSIEYQRLPSYKVLNVQVVGTRYEETHMAMTYQHINSKALEA